MRLVRLVAVSTLLALPAAAQYIDSIPMGEKSVEGEVQKLTYKGAVVVLSGGGSFEVLAEQIKGEISWDETSIPPAMSNAKAQMAGMQYDKAAENFAKALASGGTRTVLKQECAFQLGECYRLSGKFTEASQAYQRLLKDHPESYFLKKVFTNVVDCYMYSSPPNFNEARKVIADASTKAKDLGLSDEFIGDLKLKDARIYEAQNQWPQAAGVYNGLVSHKTQRIAWAAQAGVAQAALVAKDYGKAKSGFQKVVDQADNSQPMTLSRAYNGLGQCLIAENKANIDLVKEALLHFLRSVTLYLPGTNDLTDDHALAMVLAARAFRTLADLEPVQEAKDKNMLEWQKMQARFSDQYGGSYPNWAKVIKEPF
jgi:tetratricopeptide (TPR) repeat protein